MDKPNRRIVWLHVTFLVDGRIEATFVIERWGGGNYKRKRRRTCFVDRLQWAKVGGLMQLARNHKDARYTLPAYDGWSVCFETLY